MSSCIKHGLCFECPQCIREEYIKRLAEQAADHSVEKVKLEQTIEQMSRANQHRKAVNTQMMLAAVEFGNPNYQATIESLQAQVREADLIMKGMQFKIDELIEDRDIFKRMCMMPGQQMSMRLIDAEAKIAELEEQAQGYYNEAADALEKNKHLDAVLAELLRLKLIKDTHGKTPEYLLLQPLAWRQARKAREK